MSTNKALKVGGILLLLVLLTFFMVPLMLMIYNSFLNTSDLLAPGISFTNPVTFNNYFSVFENASFAQAVLNSVIVSVCVTALTVVCGATSAYAFTRFRVFGSEQLSNSILIARMIPSVVLAIPLYIVGQNLNILNTYFILIVAITTFALPFQIWMLLGFFAQIPKSLDESARIDGCSYYQAFSKVILPAVSPGLAATAIMTFFFSWNELFFVLVLAGIDTKTAPMAIMDFMGYRNFDWGAILASGVVLMIPTLIIGIILKRYMVSGLTAGAVKG